MSLEHYTETKEAPKTRQPSVRATEVDVEEYLCGVYGAEFYHFVFLASLESEAEEKLLMGKQTSDTELLMLNRIKRTKASKKQLKT